MAKVPTRLGLLRAKIKRLRADSFLILARSNLRYITGFTGEDSAAVVTPDETILFTDGRFRDQAAEECPAVRVVLRPKGMTEALAAEAKRLRLRRIAFASSSIMLSFYQRLKELLGPRRLLAAKDIILNLRMVKDEGEVEAIIGALRVSEKAFMEVRIGGTEKETAWRLENRMRVLGAESEAFETIAAAGERAALPHARPTDQRITGREALLIDWGARVGGYNSDLTRVWAPRKIPSEWGRIYRVVSDAALKAVEALKPGVSARDVDSIARRHIEKAGYGKAFLHSLGHGVGLDVHELPGIGPYSRHKLLPGMVVTIEPGIYLAGKFGIRIEDMFLITAHGAKKLSTLSRRAETWRLS